MHLVSKAWILFFPSRVSKQGPFFKATKMDGGDKTPVQLEVACEADGLAPPDPVGLAIAAIAEAI